MVTRAKYAIATLSLLFAAAITVIVVYYDDMNEYMISHSDRRAAVYDGYTFIGLPEFVWVSIETLADARLYVEVPSGERFLLKDLPEETAAKYTLERHDNRKHPILPRDEIVYSTNKTVFVYRQGKLRSVFFWLPGKAFHFSPRLEGPYLALPASLEQLIEIFGEPLRWERAGHMGPQF